MPTCQTSSSDVRRLSRGVLPALLALVSLTFGARLAAAQLAPLSYALTMPAPESHVLEVELTVPAGVGPGVELMMPVWSPGYYKVEDYAAHVSDVKAYGADGRARSVEHPRSNRWRVSGGGPVVVRYKIFCNDRSVTTNYLGADYAVLNGAPTFMTLVEPPAKRPHAVRFTLPAGWTVMTGLANATGAQPLSFQADSYDTLVDSPILAGPLGVRTFEVSGKLHVVASVGDASAWDAAATAADLKTYIEEVARFWGFLPYDKYVFLLMFRPGGGGLEHMNSTLSTVLAGSREGPAAERGRWASLGLAAHEYFHLFNAKRLRPLELGPFDYEHPPTTGSLWMAEGVTSYYSDLLLARAGLRTPDQHLASLSRLITSLQGAPGRLLQTVDESSRQVWNNSNSGVNPAATTVSYYTKGNVMGLLLDARIRRATSGRRSLDDVMRAAYAKYAGERGYTASELQAVAEEVAGAKLDDWFRGAVLSTAELDYSDLLEWFGLRFAPGSWTLERAPGATEVQTQNLAAWLAGAQRR